MLHAPVKLYPTARGDYERTKHVVQLLYGDGLLARGKAALALARSVGRDLFQR